MKHKDKRVLVLIALGAGVLLLNQIGFGRNATSSIFLTAVQEKGRKFSLVQVSKNISMTFSPGISQLSTQTACADTPPQLALFFNLPMPVNRADAQDLVMLPGIGPRISARILNYRAEHGTLKPKDLTKIQGIGPSMTKRLQPLLCFD